MWPVTRSTVQVALLASGCFGVVTVVVLATELALGVDAVALIVGTLVYAYVIWTWRETLGLGAFQAALRRRSSRPGARVAAEV